MRERTTATAGAIGETLEARRLLSVSVTGGVLRVYGSSGDDVITVAPRAGGSNQLRITENGKVTDVRAADVDVIRIHGRLGNDEVRLSRQVHLPSILFGDGGEDLLIGGSGDDRLVGGRGDDELHGRLGRDRLVGEAGDDDLHGEQGQDGMTGGAGEDVFQSIDRRSEYTDFTPGEDGVRIRLSEAPVPVRAAVLDLLAGNDFENLLRESDDGRTVFELEWEVDGVPHSAKINLDGDVIELEVEIDPADLPDAVVDAIASRYPDGEVTEAETLQLPGRPLMYEVEVENAGLVRELVVTAGGEILDDSVEGPVEA